MEEIWKSEWGGKICYSHDSSHSKGVMNHFNPKLDFQTASIVANKKREYLLVEVTIYDSTFVLCNVYAPNDISQQKKLFTKLSNILQPYSDKQIIMGGDFNCALTGAR